MNMKHHQANVSTTLRDAGDAVVQKHNATVKVYNTNFSFPSVGTDYYVFNSYIVDGDLSGPDFASPADKVLVGYGKLGNIFLDWEGGGPEAVTTDRWQSTIQGKIWGMDVAHSDVTFKLVYSGGVVLSTDDAHGNYETSPYGNLTDILLDDWDSTSTSEVQTQIVSTSISGLAYIGSGAFAFRLRYWNRTGTPHLLCYVKRDGVDDDFVLMGASTTTTNSVSPSSTYAADQYVLDDVISWNITREHDNVTSADILVYVEDTTSSNAYDAETESFGNIKKGNYIEIESGYNGTEVKRFVGNISGSVQVSREDDGAYITLHCEGIEGFLIDSLNFNFPNNAMYSHAGYFTSSLRFYEPDGVERPSAFDGWNLTAAIKAVALQSGVDDYYLSQYRQFYTETGEISTSSTKLLREQNLLLSRQNIAPDINVNINEQPYIWVYDFGQDTAYDIVKDMLSKYGFYLASIAGGSLCGSFELIEVETPSEVETKINTTGSSGYTEGIKTEYAEGFLTTEMGAGSSTVIVDWDGKGATLLMGVGPELSDSITVSYKVNSSDGDWTNVAGVITDNTLTNSEVISTLYTDTTYDVFSYEHVNAPAGGNPSMFSLIFSYDADGNAVSLPYGSHQLRLVKTTTEKAYLEGVAAFDYGTDSYKQYTTYNGVTSFGVENSIADIRNDIVVLGAHKGGFSFTADEEDLSEVKDKYITSRAVDPRSIHDPTAVNYVGRRKQFIIEDPTIVTQERADWLSIHTLDKYRVTSSSGSVNIPCDLGLQLYDTIQVEDIKTGSIDSSKQLFVNGISEAYTKDGYTMSVNFLTHWIPLSFRKRAQLSLSDIQTYFNNNAVAFEKMTVPVLPDRTGYDPMSAEDGFYVDFEWTLLLPGIHSLEIYDTRSGAHSEHSNYVIGANALTAVPFVGVYEYPGKYRAKWDGVHEGYDLNEKFKDTVYELFKLPAGHGFGCRGQNTALIDQVDPIAIEDNDFRAARVLQFPLYPIIKYEPVFPEHSTVKKTTYFGVESDTGYRDGTPIDAGDSSAFDIQHFDLEERQHLYWDFNYEHYGNPTDQNDFMAYTRHGSELGDDVDAVFAPSENRSLEYQINNDITHRVMQCDPKRPFGEADTSSYINGYGLHRTRPMNMPMIDETASIRMFVDGTYAKRRRYYVNTAKMHIHVVSHMVDEVNYTVNAFTYSYNDPDGGGDIIENGPAGSLTRRFNYTFVQPVTDIELSEFTLSKQKLLYKKWTYLPGIDDSTTEDSVIFESVLKNQEFVLNHIDYHTINYDSTITGLGVGKVFAIQKDKIIGSSLEDLPYLKNSSHSYNIPSAFATAEDPLSTTLQRYLAYRNWGTETEGIPYMYGYKYFSAFSGIGKTLETYDGVSFFDRKLYNSIVVSIEYLLIDRLGRAYYSSAKTDKGRVLIGRGNEIEFHSQIGREMCGYVNRWNPYLPSACYFEREPATMTNYGVGGAICSNFQDGAFTSYNCDYDGMNLTDKVINQADTSAGGTIYNATTPYPVKSIKTKPDMPGHIGISWYVNPIGLPRVFSKEEDDGALFAYYGSKPSQYNSHVWQAEAITNPGRRDNTAEEEFQLGAWGLPLYVSGGYCNRTIHIDTSVKYVLGSIPVDATYAIKDLSLSSLPYFYKDGDSWSNWYVREYANGEPWELKWDSARAGLYSFFKNMPVFTLVGGGRYTKNVNF